jgi:iron complex transport system ATP-binding protein
MADDVAGRTRTCTHRTGVDRLPAAAATRRTATGLDIAGREDLLDALNTVAADHPRLSTVLVTHHLEELPSSTSHALMLRAGQVIASGPITETLTSSGLSACFDHELHVERIGGRWTVRSQHLSP